MQGWKGLFLTTLEMAGSGVMGEGIVARTQPCWPEHDDGSCSHNIGPEEESWIYEPEAKSLQRPRSRDPLPVSHFLSPTSCLSLPVSHFLSPTSCLPLPVSYWLHILPQNSTTWERNIQNMSLSGDLLIQGTTSPLSDMTGVLMRSDTRVHEHMEVSSSTSQKPEASVGTKYT